MKLTSPRYAFTSAYLKAEEARCMTGVHMDDMIKGSRSIDDLMEIIKDTDIGEYFMDHELESFEKADSLLTGYHALCLERLERLSLPPQIRRLSMLHKHKFDLANTKTALRSIFTTIKAEGIRLGQIQESGLLDELMKSSDIKELADVLRLAGMTETASVVGGIKEDDPWSQAESSLEGAYFEGFISEVSSMDDGDLLAKALGIHIDITNLKTVFRNVLGSSRSRSFLPSGLMLTKTLLEELLSAGAAEIPHKLAHTQYHDASVEIIKLAEKDITAIETTMEKLRIELSRHLLSARSMSNAGMLWHLIVKETEMRNMRIILKAWANNIPAFNDYLVRIQ